MGQIAEDLVDLNALRALDPDALSAVFDSFAPLIYRYALRLCRDPQQADQIVGDVFARLLERLAAGEGPQTNLRSYLFQIAYHVVIDHTRNQKRITNLDVAQAVASVEKSPSAQVEEKMVFDALVSAVANDLTDEQQQVILLRFQEDFSLKETAEIMGKDVNAIKALQNRGVNKLRQVLAFVNLDSRS